MYILELFYFISYVGVNHEYLSSDCVQSSEQSIDQPWEWSFEFLINH